MIENLENYIPDKPISEQIEIVTDINLSPAIMEYQGQEVITESPGQLKIVETPPIVENDDHCTVRAGKKFRPDSGELKTVLPTKIKSAEVLPQQGINKK